MENNHVLSGGELDRFLARKRSINIFQSYISFDSFLTRVLEMANRFAPSEAVSILLDDPLTKSGDASGNTLRFVATSGLKAESMIGKVMRADQGIVGYVYTQNTMYLTNTPYDDPYFDSTWDRENNFRTRSICAAPIHIEKAVCGVLEMVNAAAPVGYTERDARLIQVFADYTCLSIQNVLDARRAQEVAQKDELTGLFNDRYFHIQLTQDILNAQKTGSDICLLFIDLDRFKSVNDQFGHLAGSQTLREVGYLLKETVDWPNATLARYGGDEFVIILPEASITHSVKMAKKIVDAIQNSTFLNHSFGFHKQPLNLKGVISCSVGVASYRKSVAFKPIPLEEIKDELIRQADHAMYHAKELGSGFVEVT